MPMHLAPRLPRASRLPHTTRRPAATRAAAPCPPTLTPPTATRWARRPARWWPAAARASWPRCPVSGRRVAPDGAPAAASCCATASSHPPCHLLRRPAPARRQVDRGWHPAAVYDAPGAPRGPVRAAATGSHPASRPAMLRVLHPPDPLARSRSRMCSRGHTHSLQLQACHQKGAG